MLSNKAYQHYKKSHIEWLGDVPAHWVVDRAKWSVLNIQNGVWGSEPEGENDLVCIRVADFDRKSLTVSLNNLTFRNILPKDRNSRLLKEGDLLLEKSGGGDKQLVGAVVRFNHTFSAVTSNFVAKMSVQDTCNGRFLTYVHSHLYDSFVNYRSIKQTTGIQNLDSQQYLDERIPYPPLEEQQKIADFLDYKTTQIDALISKNEVLLLKLEEKRSALITQAVTKGINPNASMKPSGVEWLGEVPAHWEVKRLKNVASYNDESLEDNTDLDYEIQYVDISSVNLLDGITNIETLTFDKAPSRARRIVRNHDIIVSTVRTYLKAITSIESPPENMIVSTGFAVIRPHENINAAYLGYLLKSDGFVGNVVANSVGVSYPAINASDLVKIHLVVPPLREQEEIANFLNTKVSYMDDQKKKVECVIAKLKEYRAALIANAVTGKIDVRDFEPSSES